MKKETKKTKMKKETKKTKKQKRKAFEKNIFLTISKVNFEGKGGKIAKTKKQSEKKEKTKTKSVREKHLFDNFQGQF
jgi:hypothetical protein